VRNNKRSEIHVAQKGTASLDAAIKAALKTLGPDERSVGNEIAGFLLGGEYSKKNGQEQLAVLQRLVDGPERSYVLASPGLQAAILKVVEYPNFGTDGNQIYLKVLEIADVKDVFVRINIEKSMVAAAAPEEGQKPWNSMPAFRVSRWVIALRKKYTIEQIIDTFGYFWIRPRAEGGAGLTQRAVGIGIATGDPKAFETEIASMSSDPRWFESPGWKARSLLMRELMIHTFCAIADKDVVHVNAISRALIQNFYRSFPADGAMSGEALAQEDAILRAAPQTFLFYHIRHGIPRVFRNHAIINAVHEFLTYNPASGDDMVFQILRRATYHDEADKHYLEEHLKPLLSPFGILVYRSPDPRTHDESWHSFSADNSIRNDPHLVRLEEVYGLLTKLPEYAKLAIEDRVEWAAMITRNLSLVKNEATLDVNRIADAAREIESARRRYETTPIFGGTTLIAAHEELKKSSASPRFGTPDFMQEVRKLSPGGAKLFAPNRDVHEAMIEPTYETALATKDAFLEAVRNTTGSITIVLDMHGGNNPGPRGADTEPSVYFNHGKLVGGIASEDATTVKITSTELARAIAARRGNGIVVIVAADCYAMNVATKTYEVLGSDAIRIPIIALGQTEFGQVAYSDLNNPIGSRYLSDVILQKDRPASSVPTIGGAWRRDKVMDDSNPFIFVPMPSADPRRTPPRARFQIGEGIPAVGGVSHA
jgi:hypothetical protein